MLTSVGYFGDYNDALRSGYLSYLTKPVRQSQMYNCLINVMNESVEITSQTKCENDKEVAKYSISQGNILLAEDNLVNQVVTRGFLETLGCYVDIVNNGMGAIKALNQKSYDMVLMDCQMPELDGFETTRLIRKKEKDDHGRHVPIIALTAHALEGDRETCLEAEMDDYLAKPFTLEELCGKLEHWLGESLQDTATVLDQTILENIRALQQEGKPLLIDKIFAIYLQTTPKLLQELRQAMDTSDVQAMRKAAHSLKSSSANVGATKLSELCKEVETFKKTESTANAVALITNIEHEYREVEKSLMLEMKGRPS
jgi:CheY-like chemotaxis protein